MPDFTLNVNGSSVTVNAPPDLANVCRCGTYVRIRQAIRTAAAAMHP